MAAYFGITTGAVEREAERIVDSIRQAFIHVDNLEGIGFLNSSGKGIQITDLNNRTENILFITFRFTVTANKIDPRFPTTKLLLDFSLILPQSDGPIALAPVTNLISALSTPPRTPIRPFHFGLSVISALTNAIDDVLKTVDETQLRQFIIDARKSTNPTPDVATPSVNRLSTFISCSSTPTMDRVRTSVASGRLSTHLGPMNFPRLPSDLGFCFWS